MRQEDAMEDEQFLTELHEIVNNYERGSYGQVIREKASYPYLYHLSEIRQNLIDWIPMEKTMRVLECAPACGALTGKLLEKAGAVTCLAEDEMHAQIIRDAAKTQERGSLSLSARRKAFFPPVKQKTGRSLM